jgi:hypothetical protein
MCSFILIVLFAQLAALDMQRFATNIVPSTFCKIPPHFSVAELARLRLAVLLIYFIELKIASHQITYFQILLLLH